MAATSGFAELRRQFPITENMTYLDAAHQTPLSLPVRAALEGFLDEGLRQAFEKLAWRELCGLVEQCAQGRLEQLSRNGRVLVVGACVEPFGLAQELRHTSVVFCGL